MHGVLSLEVPPLTTGGDHVQLVRRLRPNRFRFLRPIVMAVVVGGLLLHNVVDVVDKALVVHVTSVI